MSRVKTNSVILTGRVSKYKEMKYFETGGAVCTIGLGVKKNEEKWSNFFIDFFNNSNRNLAEEVGENVKEGDYITIKGRLSENRFTPKELEGKLDEKGNQITKSQIKVIAYDWNRVKWNDELEGYETIEE